MHYKGEIIDLINRLSLLHKIIPTLQYDRNR